MKTTFKQGDELVIVDRVQDVAPFLRNAAEERALGLGKMDDMHHVMDIPAIVIEQYMFKHNVTYHEVLNNSEHIMRMVRDPDLAGFRTKEGKY